MCLHYDSTRITPRLEFINILNQLGELPREEKEKSCVYIDMNNIATLSGRCYEKPFVVPALTGMALIHGGLSKSCSQSHPWFSGYGYEYYDVLEDTNASQKDIINKAKSYGFRSLYFFDHDNKSFTRINL